MFVNREWVSLLNQAIGSYMYKVYASRCLCFFFAEIKIPDSLCYVFLCNPCTKMKRSVSPVPVTQSKRQRQLGVSFEDLLLAMDHFTLDQIKVIFDKSKIQLDAHFDLLVNSVSLRDFTGN